MTTLGAALYTGFFVAAAMWLFLTSEAAADAVRSDGIGQRQDVSDPADSAEAAVGSDPSLITHSSHS